MPNLCNKSAAEINRTAFNVAEGESLLVPGFNVDYGGADVALAQFICLIF